MTTKYNVGDEFTLKVKVANIFTDRSGTSYMVKIIANNGENLAGSYMNYDEKTLEKIVEIPESYPMTAKEIEERIASSDDGNYLNNLYNEAHNALKNQGLDYALEWAKAE